MIKAAGKRLKYTKEMSEKSCIKNKIIDFIEKRRKYKNRNSEKEISEYKKYRNLVNWEAKRAKEEWLNNLCTDINFYLSNA